MKCDVCNLDIGYSDYRGNKTLGRCACSITINKSGYDIFTIRLEEEIVSKDFHDTIRQAKDIYQECRIADTTHQ